MSIKVMTQVWDSDLQRDKKYILLSLADWANDEGENVYPSLGRVAWKTQYSIAQVKAIVKKLVGESILIKQGEMKSGTVIYKINLEALPKRPPYQPPKKGRPKAKDPIFDESDTENQAENHTGFSNNPESRSENHTGLPDNRSENHTDLPKVGMDSNQNPLLNINHNIINTSDSLGAGAPQPQVGEGERTYEEDLLAMLGGVNGEQLVLGEKSASEASTSGKPIVPAAPDPAPAVTGRGRKKKEPDDETTKYPEVQIYRGATNYYPRKPDREDMHRRVTDLDKWSETVDHWLGHGWSRMNVQGMLGLYERGGKAGCTACKKNGVGVAPAKTGGIRETEETKSAPSRVTRIPKDHPMYGRFETGELGQ